VSNTEDTAKLSDEEDERGKTKRDILLNFKVECPLCFPKLTIKDPHPVGTLLGCGVTASSMDDALAMLREQVFRSDSLPILEKCIEDVSTVDLDSKHVLPNCGDLSKRGVWFPLGY
jgi:hypothetical protein